MLYPSYLNLFAISPAQQPNCQQPIQAKIVFGNTATNVTAAANVINVINTFFILFYLFEMNSAANATNNVIQTANPVIPTITYNITFFL